MITARSAEGATSPGTAEAPEAPKRKAPEAPKAGSAGGAGSGKRRKAPRRDVPLRGTADQRGVGAAGTSHGCDAWGDGVKPGAIAERPAEDGGEQFRIAQGAVDEKRRHGGQECCCDERAMP